MSEFSLRDRLRIATAQDHQALDALITGWRIESVQGYRAFLTASAQALWPLELALDRSGAAAWAPDWPRRARRQALLSDLQALGLKARLPPHIIPSTPAFGAGVLYVLEGSRLGARVLSRQVLATGQDLPLAYLTHGAEQNFWRSFLVWLESAPNVGFRTDAIEAGARYGFRCFSEAFESLAHPTGGANVRGCDHVRV